MDPRRVTGQMGEQFAAQYLERALGWEIQCRNWRCRYGEIDIVARDGDCLVITEVRSRSGDGYGSGIDSVDRRKALRLRLLMGIFMQTRKDWSTIRCRCDVIGLAIKEGLVLGLTHIRDALDGLI